MPDSQLLTAMQEPLVVDSAGKLLRLRGDGATVLVDSRNIYRGAGGDSRYSWVATNSGVTIRRADGWHWSHEFPAHDARPEFGRRGDLPVVLAVAGDEHWALLWSNGLISYCVAIHSDEATVTGCQNFRVCDGQWNGGVLETVGMRARSMTSKSMKGAATALGIGECRNLSKPDADSSKQKFRFMQHDPFAHDIAQFATSKFEDFPKRPYPESIVAMNGQRIIVQYTVPNLLLSEDADLMGVEPSADEAEGLACCLSDEKFSLISIEHRLAYIGSCFAVDGSKHLYGIRKGDCWGAIGRDNMVRIAFANHGSDLSCEPVRIESLPDDQLVTAAHFSHLPLVGHVGSLETSEAADRTRRRHWLIRSEQGLEWKVMHEIG